MKSLSFTVFLQKRDSVEQNETFHDRGECKPDRVEGDNLLPASHARMRTPQLVFGQRGV